MAENIIGKNLDNITNVAKGIDKEMLDMTYGDKYYRDVIQPAKLGKGPMPSRMQMIGQNLRNFGPVKAMFIGAQPGKYGERAKPTAAASKFLNTLGKGAKFLGTKAGPLGILDILTPTKLGADDMVTQEMRDSIDTTGINSLRGDPAQFSGEDPFLSETPDYTDGELYDIDDTGRIPTITDRLKGGLGSIRDTVTDKLGSVGDFIKGGGILGNILGGFGKRGDESTRGIAGLNVNDVFNVDQFGTEEDPTKDPYGINIVSAKGNYKEYVKNKARELAKMQFKTKTGKQRQDFYKQAADEIRAKEAAELKAALQRAQAEINRMGYRDYGSGGADTFDTSNIDDAGNYSDSLDPGQTE
tara:strand:+ start:1192 stop:2259 length:1068 start_codon:yes stop_codon:yes gene_type:complete